MKKLLLLATVVGCAAVTPGLAEAHGIATHFFDPAVKYTGRFVQTKPRLITSPQKGYTIRYAISFWSSYGHSAATATATAYTMGRSFPVRLTFTGPRRIPLRNGQTWWEFTRLTVNNFHHSYPDTGYNAYFRGYFA